MADLDDDLIGRARTACASAIDSLNACVTKIVDGIALEHAKEASYDQAAVQHLAWLTHQIIVIMREIKDLDRERPSGRKTDAKSLFR